MRAGAPSRTAQHNALFRALEARRPVGARIADDRLAVRFLPLKFRVIAEVARARPIRRLVEEVIDRRWPGPRAGVVLRTRLVDDAIAEALTGADQVLILGAGFDTRSYRLPGMDAARVFEVDHPSTQALKERTVRRAIGSIPANVTFVPVEFGRDDLEGAVRAAGFQAAARTIVLWEGVTNYLTADAVDGTFRSIASLVDAGSPVLFTYIERAMLDGTKAFDGATESSEHVQRVGEPYTFGFHPDEVPAYLAERGFDLVWDTNVPDAAERYRVDRPNGYAYYHVCLARRH